MHFGWDGWDVVGEWRCKGGHVLGWVARRGRLRELLVLRNAGQPSLAPLPEIDVVGLMSAGEVRCSVCGEVRTWAPDRETRRRWARG